MRRKKQSRLRIAPIVFREACAYVRNVHRHHDAPRGQKWAISAYCEKNKLRGVLIASRPVSRVLQALKEPWIEFTRVATDGTPNACSKLYGAGARIAREMGYAWAVTYTLVTEPGTSLIASGWKQDGEVADRSWSTKSRPRSTPQLGAKKRWTKYLGGHL